MKKHLLTLSLVIASLCVSAQTKKSIDNSTIITEMTHQYLVNGIAVLTGGTEIDINQVKLNFRKSIASKGAGALLRNKTAIDNYLANISEFGNSTREFYVDASNDLPFGFYKFNGQVTFLQSGIFSKNIYNIILLNESERASAVVKDMLLPGLSNFEPLMSVPEISYFCLIGGFTSGDFNDERTLDKNGETVAIIISKSVLKKYLDAEITDEQVFKLASFYNGNPTTSGKIKKISIK